MNHCKASCLVDQVLNGCEGTPGVEDCKAWIRSYLIDYHGMNAAKVPL